MKKLIAGWFLTAGWMVCSAAATEPILTIPETPDSPLMPVNIELPVPPKGPVCPIPPAGVYAGVMRVTKSSTMADLSVTTTVKVVARVYSNGLITMLTESAAQPQGDAHLQNSKVSLLRDTEGRYNVTSLMPATVSVSGGVLKITYTDGLPIQYTGSNGTIGDTWSIQPEASTAVTVTLRLKKR